MSNSSLKKIIISNIGPFQRPVSIEISDIVCLVGQNNSGKSTVLDCYDLIFSKSISQNKINKNADSDPYVELWVEIPLGTPNVGDKWIKNDYPDYSGIPIVRSKWTWSRDNLLSVRSTYDKELNDFSTGDNAAGLDAVFVSRLPKPLRIGAFDQPDKEKEGLLKLILDPIVKDLQKISVDQESELGKSANALKKILTAEINRYKEIIDGIQVDVQAQYTAIFDSHKVHISIQPHEHFIDIDAYLKKATDILVGEGDHLFPIKSQGTGSQRTLFWSLLKVRSALQAKLDLQAGKQKQKIEIGKKLTELDEKILGWKNLEKRNTKQTEALAKAEIEYEKLNQSNSEDSFERGYILMIDEPEIALHPAAVRLAKNQLYKLAKDVGWQVLMTTHHPAFIDPTEDHTTIVRIDKSSEGSKTFRSDLEKFKDNEKSLLGALLKFDLSFGEIFFAKEVIVVEGDTEYSVFQDILGYAGLDVKNKNRVVIRAGGKGTIPLVLRILRQFKIPHGVLHDVDSPKTKNGNKNSAYTINQSILDEVNKTRDLNIKVFHCVSVPNFELAHSIFSSGDGKPLDVVNKLRNDDAFQGAVRKIGNQLVGLENIEYSGQLYEDLLKKWIVDNKIESDPRYVFG